jgi:surface antigen/peptidoglycan hydrolase CwlO-like protein
VAAIASLIVTPPAAGTGQSTSGVSGERRPTLGGGLLRGGSKLLLIVGTLACLVGTLGPTAPGAGASTPPQSAVSALQAQRDQLGQQLLQMQGLRLDARQHLLGVEARLTAVEARLASTRATLDRKDAELRNLSARIATDEQTLATSSAQLAALLRSTYEVSQGDGFVAAILASNDFFQAIDRVRAAQHINDQLASLQAQVSDAERSLLKERTQVQRDFQDAQALEGQLSQQSGQLLAAVAERDLAFRAVDGPARTLAAQIVAIDDQLAPPGPVGPVDTSHSCGDRFAFGNCTYYVATRRCIPWLGNAWEWWGKARAYGYAEGQIPQAGAIVVWGAGGSSPVGHVAYVEAVGPTASIPAGSFLISEMNFIGWDRVNYRVVRVGSPGILGFIYGKV